MKIISNSAISLDGKLNTRENAPFVLGSKNDLRRMHEIRSFADAILVGGSTFRNWPYPSFSSLGKGGEKILNVIVTRDLRIKLNKRFCNSEKIKPLFLTTAKNIPRNFPFEVVRSARGISPRWIVSEMKKRGVKTLLIEAGGNLITQFLSSGLLDEMYVTVTPWLIGGEGAPALISGHGFSKNKIKSFKILDCQKRGSEIFLHLSLKKKSR